MFSKGRSVIRWSQGDERCSSSEMAWQITFDMIFPRVVAMVGPLAGLVLLQNPLLSYHHLPSFFVLSSLF